jgi:hypothetical protein
VQSGQNSGGKGVGPSIVPLKSKKYPHLSFEQTAYGAMTSSFNSSWEKHGPLLIPCIVSVKRIN